MRWLVWTEVNGANIEEVVSSYEVSDDAVDALIDRVREHLDATQDHDIDAGLWRDNATTNLLKHYLDGAEGASHDMETRQVKNLHVKVGEWTFRLEPSEEEV